MTKLTKTEQLLAYLNDYGPPPNMQKANLCGAYLYGADLTGLDFSYASFDNANLAQANLDRAILVQAFFAFANCDRTRFCLTDCTRANFSCANLYRANFNEATMAHVMMPRANLCGASLYKADLHGARLDRAKCRETNFHEVNLSGAQILESDLSYANLSKANLTGTKLQRVILTDTDLSQAIGIVSAAEFIDRLESCPAGVYAYKCFGATTYLQPWEGRDGEILVENVNPNRTDACGCGVNVGNREWMRYNPLGYRGRWKKVLIRWVDLADAVVPFDTDGKFRVSRCQVVGDADQGRRNP